MMYDFEALLEEVIRNKPEMSRGSLMELVQEKKRAVGAGYLTDQGALFLVAGELGVRLQHLVSADLTLKDIQLGANDITVVARVLAVYPISEFEKKDGSGVGRYRRVSLFDRSGITKLTIWEDNQEAMKLSGISVDTPVRVVSGYVKQGLDGKPSLNIGKRGRIEVVADPAIASKLVSLATLSKQVEDIREGDAVLVVDGVAASDSRSSTFVRRDDGSAGSFTQFELRGAGGRATRVVIWEAASLPEVKTGASLRITNLKCRKRPQGEAELHGDNGTTIRLLSEKSPEQGPQPVVKVADISKQGAGKVSLEVMALSKGSVREVSLKDGSTTKKGEVVLGDDTGEITAVAWNDASKVIGEIQVGEKLRVRGAAVQVSKMGVQVLELDRSSKVERF